MTEQEIMQLVEEAGMFAMIGPSSNLLYHEIASLLRFANLVAEREREACAKVCDHYAMALDHVGNEYTRSRECQQAAAAIRARGEKGGAE